MDIMRKFRNSGGVFSIMDQEERIYEEGRGILIGSPNGVTLIPAASLIGLLEKRRNLLDVNGSNNFTDVCNRNTI